MLRNHRISLHSRTVNLLFIQTDQLSANALGYAGCPYVETPHIDRLAARSLNFSKTYCAFPKCVPSRTAWTYGRMPHEIMLPGTETDMGARLGDPERGIHPEFKAEELGHWFAAQGYDCVYAGKWHVGQWGPTESLREEFGSGFRSLCPINDPEVPRVCGDYFEKRDPEKPFLMVASFDNPHNICEYGLDAALPWGNLPIPLGLADLPPFPANAHQHPEEPQVIRQMQTDARHRLGYSSEDWRRYRWAYYRLVEKVDAKIGQLLDSLENAGLMSSTAILFSSDHGDMQGTHGLPQKDTFYEESAHVPFLLYVPGMDTGLRPDLVNNGLDIFPTLCDLAGIATPAGMHGRSLIAGHREPPYVASELKLRSGSSGRMIRSERFKYIAFDTGPRREQLFDLEQDPREMENLAGLNAFAQVLGQHRDYLRDWITKTADPFGKTHYAHPGKRDTIPGDSYLPDTRSRE